MATGALVQQLRWKTRIQVSSILKLRTFSSSAELTEKQGSSHQHGGLKPAEEPRSKSVAFAMSTEAKPLKLQSQLQLYVAPTDIQEIGSHAYAQLRWGTGLAAVGFTTFLYSIAPTLPPPLLAGLCAGASANLYGLWSLSNKSLRRFALRHVEEIALLPSSSGTGTDQESPEKSEHSQSLMEAARSAATMEDRLEATPSLELEIRTATTRHWVRLVPAQSDDSRASFADICSRMRLLHLDVENGISADPPLLKALAESSKVAAEEQAIHRTDVGAWLALPDASAQPHPLLFTDVQKEEVAKVGSTPTAAPPSTIITQLGQRAFYAGVGVFVAGASFLVGEAAKDADGVPRWSNLRIPTLTKWL
mmetsp:Transcript_20001/g.46555  ORF Transcript_20001/g.46555 Transcript_20001/m.46555 type:complete len:363 (+) Transcript_20001:72-1160(+)